MSQQRRRAGVPSYRKHRASGQALVTLPLPGGVRHDVYLGPHGTNASKSEYERVVGEWLANGRRLPGDIPSDYDVNELFAEFLRFAKRTYRRDGRPTGEVAAITAAIEPLKRLYGRTPVLDFGPLALKTVRDAMIEKGWSRTTVNDQINRIRRGFRWGTENELVPPSVFHALQAVAGLRKGRSEAKESKPVTPVPEADIEAVLSRVSAEVAAMIQVQLLTGMRPGEVVQLRACDLDRSDEVWVFSPRAHKTEHFGHQRVVMIGPRAQEVLRPWLLQAGDPEARLFTACNAEARRREALKKPGRRRKSKRKRSPSWRATDAYRTDSYRRAIAHACKDAKVTQWSPNQLRHNAATRLRKEFGIEAARVVLGHRSAAVTEVYAEIDQAQAREAMKRIG